MITLLHVLRLTRSSTEAGTGLGAGAEYRYYAFERNLNAFKVAFAKNYESASTNFSQGIGIDGSIRQDGKEIKVLSSLWKPAAAANNKLDDVSVKKRHTPKIPTMKAKFEALKGVRKMDLAQPVGYNQ